MLRYHPIRHSKVSAPSSQPLISAEYLRPRVRLVYPGPRSHKMATRNHSPTHQVTTSKALAPSGHFDRLAETPDWHLPVCLSFGSGSSPRFIRRGQVRMDSYKTVGNLESSFPEQNI